jgi:hypothetical protein
MSQLEAMGFPTIRCQKALLATGNNDADTAMTWLFEHMEDPGKLPCPVCSQKANVQILMCRYPLPPQVPPQSLGRPMTRSP